MQEREENGVPENGPGVPGPAGQNRASAEGERSGASADTRRAGSPRPSRRFDPQTAAQVEEWRLRQETRAVPASYRDGDPAKMPASIVSADDDVLDAQNEIPQQGRPVRTRPPIPNYQPREELDAELVYDDSDAFGSVDASEARGAHNAAAPRFAGAGDAARSALETTPEVLRDSAAKVGEMGSALVEDVRESRAAAETRAFVSSVPERLSTAGKRVGAALHAEDGTLRKKPIAILVIVAAYLVLALYYSFHYYPFTSIGPVEVGGMDAVQASQAIGEAVDGYVLQVKGDVDGDGSYDGEGDISFTVMGSDAGLSLDSAELARQAMAADPGLLWPVEILLPHNHSDLMVASADVQGFREKISDAVEWYNQDATAPVDATIAYDEDGGSFEIVPEERGNTLDAEKITEEAVDAITSMRSVLEIDGDDYLQPSVLQDDERLQAALADAQKVLQTHVTFTAHDSEVASLDGATAAKWVTTDEDVQMTLDEDQVNAWVQDLVEKSSTVGNKRTWTREDGTECTVQGGVYGWQADWLAVDEALHDAVTTGSTEDVEVPMQQEAAVYDGPNGRDWKAYIDVDIDAQHATYYDEDGKVLWEADFVSGIPDEEHATPEGVYYINNKESPSTLIGDSTATGSPEYETVVQYWMPWDGNSVGFHDASWQTAFGGQRYDEGYGSHGCINLSEEAAEALYKVADVGTVVVCHSGTGLSTSETSDGLPSTGSSDGKSDESDDGGSSDGE